MEIMRKKILIQIIAMLPGVSLFAQQYNIWTLDKCIEYAFVRNIQVRKKILSNKTKVLYADLAKAQRFPSLGASAEQNFNWSKSSAPASSGLAGSNGTSYSLNTEVTLFNYFRINNLIKQAELDIQSGVYSLETTKESISISILNAYLQVLYAGEHVKNSRKQIESTESQLNFAGEKLAIKGISHSDFALIKSQLAGEKLSLANSESQLAIARVNLMQLMDLPVTPDFQIAQPDPGENINQNRVPDVMEVYAKALAIKPQIKNAEIGKELAALEENIEKAGYYPVLSASAGIGSSFKSIKQDSYFTQVNDDIRPGVGLSLSIPVYQRKQVKTNVALSKLHYQSAELDELDIKNQLRKNIEQACQDVVSAQAEYEASMEKYNATNESSMLSDEKFRQGLINSVDYLVQKTNLIEAESQLLQSKYNLIISYNIMDFYMGVLFTL